MLLMGMAQGALLRFLDLLRQELGADDARAEVGGRRPDDARLLWSELPGGWRLVVVFDTPPEDRKAKQEHLQRLVEGFSQSATDGSLPFPSDLVVDSAFRRLDAALEALRTRTGGVAAMVVDLRSPVLWGSSEPQRHAGDVEHLMELGGVLIAAREAGLDLDTLLSLDPSDLGTRLRDLGIDADGAGALGRTLDAQHDSSLRRHLLAALAVARARAEANARSPRWAHHEPQFGYFIRSFANIYLLVVVFEGAFSELHVESTVLHALPAIERLLLSLPPLDPKPRGARVIKLRG